MKKARHRAGFQQGREDEDADDAGSGDADEEVAPGEPALRRQITGENGAVASGRIAVLNA